MPECPMTATDIREAVLEKDRNDKYYGVTDDEREQFAKLADWVESGQFNADAEAVQEIVDAITEEQSPPWVSVEDRLPEFPCPILRKVNEKCFWDYLMLEMGNTDVKTFCETWDIIGWLDWRSLPVPSFPEE